MKVSPQDLKDRILRALGAPIVAPNITENQIYQAIDDAIKYYTDFHYSGSHKDYLIIRANEDMKDGIAYFQLNDNVLAVTQIIQGGKNLPLKGIATTDGATDVWFSNLFQTALGGYGSGTSCSVGLSSLNGLLPFFTILDMNIGLWKKQVQPYTNFIYDSNNRILAVIDQKISEGDIIICEAYVKSTLGMFEGGNSNVIGGAIANSHVESLNHLDNYSYTQDMFHNMGSINSNIGESGSKKQNVLDDRWVIEYATAKAKYYWGMNLTYVSGVSQSSGGVKVDGQILKEEAMIEMNRLRDEIRKMGNQPIMLMG